MRPFYHEGHKSAHLRGTYEELLGISVIMGYLSADTGPLYPLEATDNEAPFLR